MARPFCSSFNEDLLLEPPAHMDGGLSSSWPRASPTSRHGRPEPPRAPLRRPSDATWEVPPLQLPTKPRKEVLSPGPSAHGSTHGSSSTREDMRDEAFEEQEDEDDEEEACVFAFEGAVEEEDDDGGHMKLQLVGFDDDDDGDVSAFGPTLTTAEAARGDARQTASQPKLGASPVLLSALERVAAEAGTQPLVGLRFRGQSVP
mmetsp:Transcript_23136/g.47140  ORF Transcript_23136/g.47140 Transcript_23136/m.47140 type:complete len:203 (-) Transcript_23136:54-662(-)